MPISPLVYYTEHSASSFLTPREGERWQVYTPEETVNSVLCMHTHIHTNIHTQTATAATIKAEDHIPRDVY